MANLKLDLQIGNMMWYNQFGVDYSDARHQGNTVRQEIFGEQEKLKYTYKSTLKLNPQSQIRINYQNTTLLAYKLLQIEEENPPRSGIWVNKTYARSKHYSEVQNNANITYLYAKIKNGNPIDQAWRIELGGNYFQRIQAQRRYPYLFRQEVNIFEGFASFNKNIPSKIFDIDVKPQISFAKGNGTMNERFDLEENPTLEPDDNWQLLPQLKHEYDYLISSKLGMGVETTVTYPLKRFKNTSLFLNAGINYRHALDTDLKAFSRTYFSINFGINF